MFACKFPFLQVTFSDLLKSAIEVAIRLWQLKMNREKLEDRGRNKKCWARKKMKQHLSKAENVTRSKSNTNCSDSNKPANKQFTVKKGHGVNKVWKIRRNYNKKWHENTSLEKHFLSIWCNVGSLLNRDNYQQIGSQIVGMGCIYVQRRICAKLNLTGQSTAAYQQQAPELVGCSSLISPRLSVFPLRVVWRCNDFSCR